MSKSRDDVSKPTSRILGSRAGYLCAFPGCKQLTIGPSDDRESGLSMVGIAAHITAASSAGPRYDPDITSDERSSEANGIWMCQVHGKLVDDTESLHTTDQLKRWKKQHEEWVFARVACADSVLKHGITSISIKNIGPFRENTTIVLGKHNVVFGPNGSGKSSLCESLAAFSGGKNFESFRNRWSLFGEGSPGMAIEVAISVRGSRTTVRLSEEAVTLKKALKHHQTRLHIEVDGNVSACWPRSFFNVIYMDNPSFKPNPLKDTFRRELRELATQFGLDENQIWDALREELFCSSTFGSLTNFLVAQ